MRVVCLLASLQLSAALVATPLHARVASTAATRVWTPLVHHIEGEDHPAPAPGKNWAVPALVLTTLGVPFLVSEATNVPANQFLSGQAMPAMAQELLLLYTIAVVLQLAGVMQSLGYTESSGYATAEERARAVELQTQREDEHWSGNWARDLQALCGSSLAEDSACAIDYSPGLEADLQSPDLQCLMVETREKIEWVCV